MEWEWDVWRRSLQVYSTTSVGRPLEINELNELNLKQILILEILEYLNLELLRQSKQFSSIPFRLQNAQSNTNG